MTAPESRLAEEKTLQFLRSCNLFQYLTTVVEGLEMVDEALGSEEIPERLRKELRVCRQELVADAREKTLPELRKLVKWNHKKLRRNGFTHTQEIRELIARIEAFIFSTPE